MSAPGPGYVLTLSCPDRTGIVAAITGFIADLGGWITEAAYHADLQSGQFFTRQVVHGPDLTPERLTTAFDQVATDLQATSWRVRPDNDVRSVVLLVSTSGHCLYELLARWHSGDLGARISAVIGNHDTLRGVAEMFGVPFHHVPVPADPAAKDAAFDRIAELVGDADTIVLARFMQVVPARWCEAWQGRLINIHHGFLPSFRGARPYHQAYARGVKMIGATCHYVTAELDAGPIIEQDVIRIDHTDTAAEMARLGRDIEKSVLARGLQLHLQDRVLLDGMRTVVFT